MAGERQLSDGNDAGTILGQSAADLISFHGQAPCDQAGAITLATGATFASIVTCVQSVLTALREKGFIAT